MQKFPRAPDNMPLAERLETFSFPVTESGCWIWMKSLNAKGYGTIGYNSKIFIASRASWMAYKGSIPEGMHVCHRCDIRCCVNPDHLFLGTPKENRADAMRKGRHKFPIMQGSSQYATKLTDNDVRQIRSSAERTKNLASKYGVSSGVISNIRLRKTWRYLP